MELDAAGLGRGPLRIERHLDEAWEVHRLDVETELAGDDPGDVEEVVDERHLGDDVALDRLERVRDARLGDAAHLHHPRPPEDGVERRSKLVAHRGHELVLQAMGHLERRLLLRELLREPLDAAARHDLVGHLEPADENARHGFPLDERRVDEVPVDLVQARPLAREVRLRLAPSERDARVEHAVQEAVEPLSHHLGEGVEEPPTDDVARLAPRG